jgi:SNF2 family DNA or RNA helicase
VDASHDAVITTYGTVMRTPWMKEYAWRHVILDEAQAIKNPGARRRGPSRRLPPARGSR